MNKITISIIILCAIYFSNTILGSDTNKVSSLYIPEGHFFIWSDFHNKKKACNVTKKQKTFLYSNIIIDSSLMETILLIQEIYPIKEAQLSLLSYLFHLKEMEGCKRPLAGSGSLTQQNSQWYIHVGSYAKFNSGCLIPIRSMNPSAVFKLAATRMHGTSAGRVGAIDNKGNRYCIESMPDRSDIGLRPLKPVRIFTDIPLDGSYNVIHKDALLETSHDGYWNEIIYTKNNKRVSQYFNDSYLTFTTEQIELISSISGQPFYLETINPFTQKITVYHITEMHGDPKNLNKHCPLDLYVEIFPNLDNTSNITVYYDAQLQFNSSSWYIHYERNGKMVYDRVESRFGIDNIETLLSVIAQQKPCYLVDKNKNIAYEIVHVEGADQALNQANQQLLSHGANHDDSGWFSNRNLIILTGIGMTITLILYLKNHNKDLSLLSFLQK